MKDKVNIICLYWVGDYRNRDFTEKDIENLRATVDKHIDRPYEFYCLTNKPDADLPAIKIPFKNDWPGWWAKVELFRPDLPCGRTLYLDTDTYIVNSLQPILDYEGDLVMFPTRRHKSTWGKLCKGGWVYRYQAATMLFTPGQLAWLYYKFKDGAEELMKMYRGEQDMYGMWIPNQPTFPKEWMVKMDTIMRRKIEYQESQLPKETIIVTGQPNPLPWRNPPEWLIKRARGD